MRIIIRNKLIRHINKLTYIALFVAAAVLISVGAVSGKDHAEYIESPTEETSVIEIVQTNTDSKAANKTAASDNAASNDAADAAAAARGTDAAVGAQGTDASAAARNAGATTGAAQEGSVVSLAVKPEAGAVTASVNNVSNTVAAPEASASKDAGSAKKVSQSAQSENAKADNPENYHGIFVMNTSGNLNIRRKANLNAEVVGVLTEGNGGTVIKYGKQWCKVRSGNVTGYVATGYILTGSKAKRVQAENGYIATVKADVLMVREKRSVNSSVLGITTNGKKFKCLKIYPGWVAVSFDRMTGYLSRDFVKVSVKKTYAKSVEEIEAEQAALTESDSSYTSANDSSVSGNVSASSDGGAGDSKVSGQSSGSSNVSSSGGDAYLLSCIVACEAGCESYEAKLAVASVIMNRVRSSVFPNSISGVVYQAGQFSPVANGSLANMLAVGPDEGSVKAANAALSGVNNVPGYLFFGRPSAIGNVRAKSCRQIDSQIFY